ncbi:tetratricopeptide repeat protein 19, mitochondrial isoform X2 [Strongylocentrotus purpuratus]|uniref:Uncharacterized protein n=1 Tax=Strongylocentrotus purpuratus TaxID=7668 RepID=A0A7M7NF80_STRPU|nr:tetratricopeptide repeat protein 19, mitochondrial isoform X2 [Strongylocentrotus purpuratus]
MYVIKEKYYVQIIFVNIEQFKMAAPMRHVLTKNLLHKYIKVDVCASKSLSFCKHGFNLNPILRENCSSLCENGIRNIHSLPPLLLTERAQSCSRNFGGGFRQVTASFFTASQYNTRQGHRFSGSSHQKSTGNFSLALGIGGFALCSAGLAFTFWQDDNKETIEKMIARAVIAERENRLGDADTFYHQATVMCEKEKNSQALLYTYDQMANFNMRHGRLMKAENLFKETLKLLLTSGIQKEDPGVVEISLKLSRIYERMGSHAKIMNLKSLLGMCLDAYARFLGATNSLAEAERMYSRALEICEGDLKVDGTPHPQTVVLLNDLATICDMRGHRDDAIEHVQRAVELAEKSSPTVLPTILCNLASMKMHKGLKDEAREIYKRALALAEKEGDREAVITIRANLQKVL